VGGTRPFLQHVGALFTWLSYNVVSCLQCIGRTARISGTMTSHLSAILRQAVLFGFDWVIYAGRDYCRVSVIPDGKMCWT